MVSSVKPVVPSEGCPGVMPGGEKALLGQRIARGLEVQAGERVFAVERAGVAEDRVADPPIAHLRQMLDLELLLHQVGGGDDVVRLELGQDGERLGVLLPLEINRHIVRQIAVELAREPLLPEFLVAHPPGPKLRLPVVRENVLMLELGVTAESAVEIFALGRARRGPADVVVAVVVDEIALEVAFEVPGLARALGDVAALVSGAHAAGRAAVAVVVQPVGGVEVAGRHRAEGFEQSPLGLHAGAERLRMLQAQTAQGRLLIRQIRAHARQIEERNAERAEGDVPGVDGRARVLQRHAVGRRAGRG